MATSPLSSLPAAIRQKLDGLRDELATSLGDNLSALMIFGSAARGEYREGVSDVDLIVVLKEATPAALTALSNPLQVARFAARIEALVLTAEEIPRAADVFPLFYDDIRSCNILLHGADPFASLVIADQHRRLRIEQELRETQMRLRRVAIDTQNSPRHFAAMVERKAKQVRGPLAALLSLHGQKTAPALAEVLAAAGAHYKVDIAPLKQARENPAAAHQALVELLTRAIDDVDRMEVPA
jgi:predicted nucleotidyltransferase